MPLELTRGQFLLYYTSKMTFQKALAKLSLRTALSFLGTALFIIRQ